MERRSSPAEPEALRVFVNGRALSVRRESTILDAARAFDAAMAEAVVAGERAVTDSRGLPIALDALVTGGMVLRIIAARTVRDARPVDA